MFVTMLRAVVSHRTTQAADEKIQQLLDELEGDPGLHAAFLVRRPMEDGRDELIVVEHWTSPAARLAWASAAPGRDPGARVSFLPGASANAYEVLSAVGGGASDPVLQPVAVASPVPTVT